MKILIIRCFPSYLSVKDATYNIQELGLAKALIKKGHICDLLFWTDREETIVTVPVGEYGAVHIYYRKGITLLKNTVFKKSNALFKEYDVLQTNEYNQIQTWLLAGRYPQKTIIYHGPYHCKYNKRYNMMCSVFDLLFKRRYIQNNTKFLAKSEMARDFLLRKGILSENITVTGVGIDIDALYVPKEKTEDPFIWQIEKDSSSLKLLYIGKIEPRRNVKLIVDIFKSIVDKNSDATLYMIGTGDSEYLNSIFSYIKKCELQDKIIWKERMQQNRLAEIYQRTDVFLLPTEYEIFGMVLLEAMYYENVVLTTKNGGSTTLIKNGTNGIILEEKNADIWAQTVLALNEEKRKMYSMQKAAKETITHGYRWDCIADKFLNMYIRDI